MIRGKWDGERGWGKGMGDRGNGWRISQPKRPYLPLCTNDQAERMFRRMPFICIQQEDAVTSWLVATSLEDFKSIITFCSLTYARVWLSSSDVSGYNTAGKEQLFSCFRQHVLLF